MYAKAELFKRRTGRMLHPIREDPRLHASPLGPFAVFPLQDALSKDHLYIYRHIEVLLLYRHGMFIVQQTNCVYWTWRFLCLTPFYLAGWRKSQDTPRSAESRRAAVISLLLQSVVVINNKGRVIFLDSNNRTWYNILKMLYTKKNVRIQIFWIF